MKPSAALAAIFLLPACAAARSEFTVRSGSGREFTASLFPAKGALKGLAVIVTGSSPADRDGYIDESGGRRNWALKDWAEGVAERGIAAVTFDKTPDDSLLEAGQRDVQAVLEAAGTQVPPGTPVFLIGHSAGANQLQMYVARREGKPAGVVLIGGGMSVAADASVLKLASRQRASLEKVLEEDPTLSRPHPETAGMTLRQVQDRVKELADGPRYFRELRAAMASGRPVPRESWGGASAEFWRQFIELSDGSAEALRRKGVPVLAVKGKEDRAFEDFENFADLVRALGAESMDFPGLDHFLLKPGETHPEPAATEAIALWMLSRALP